MNIKTNAMRILDKDGIHYSPIYYDANDGLIDGVSVAQKIGKQPAEIYKTLIAKGSSGQYFCFVIPVDQELNLKAAAKSVGEKSVAMIKVHEINAVTGYIRGGCSPIGLKKPLKTVFDRHITTLPLVTVSGGKIGCQIELQPDQLIQLVDGKTDSLYL